MTVGPCLSQQQLIPMPGEGALRPSKARVPLGVGLDASDFELEHLKNLAMAPKGWSGRSCLSGHFMPVSPQWQPGGQKCACGKSASRTALAILASDIDLVLDTSAVFKRTWFHSYIPQSNLWSDKIPEWSHVGSSRAASFRADSLLKQDINERHDIVDICTIEFEVLQGSAISNTILVDEPLIDASHVVARHLAGSGVSRYVNRQEDPGSISLVLPSVLLREVGRDSRQVSNPHSQKALLQRFAEGRLMKARDQPPRGHDESCRTSSAENPLHDHP